MAIRMNFLKNYGWEGQVYSKDQVVPSYKLNLLAHKLQVNCINVGHPVNMEQWTLSLFLMQVNYESNSTL
jgi:hypothetical protein